MPYKRAQVSFGQSLLAMSSKIQYVKEQTFPPAI